MEPLKEDRHMNVVKYVVLALALCALPTVAAAQAPPPDAPATAVQEPKPSLEVYGFAMLDMGFDFKQINPNWFDTLRLTRLPKVEDEFGKDGSTFAGVRQTRFGVRTSTPTALGELKTTFEFELFGTGVDEGQTTFRLRHAYGELGHFGAGQWWSAFVDTDAFPNSLEYWGPTGLAWFRNVQVRWIPPIAKGNLILALERPGASGDGGTFADRIELQNVKGRNVLPDFTGAYKFTGPKWGYMRVAGALRKLTWDDLLDDQFELGDSAIGWGVNLSSNVNAGKSDVVRLQLVFGEGIENYMNDSPIDVAVQNNPSNPVQPLLGKPLPVVGISAFVDHKWNDKWTSAFGYSRQDIDNTDGQTADAFKAGQYALGNLLHTPAPNVMLGGELQWGRRENFGGFHSDGFKFQFSFKYNFGMKLGG
jgi:hypothetical protein